MDVQVEVAEDVEAATWWIIFYMQKIVQSYGALSIQGSIRQRQLPMEYKE